MTIKPQSFLRAFFTVTILLIAVVLVRLLWISYMYSPWTRDGRVPT